MTANGLKARAQAPHPDNFWPTEEASNPKRIGYG